MKPRRRAYVDKQLYATLFAGVMSNRDVSILDDFEQVIYLTNRAYYEMERGGKQLAKELSILQNVDPK